MSRRLEVRLSDAEWEGLRRSAQARGQTASAWVRELIRRSIAAEGDAEVARKLRALAEASRHSFPAPDIEQMLRECGR